MLPRYPYLRDAPFKGSLSARHCAAQAGNLTALRLLLEDHPSPTIDLPLPEAEVSDWSYQFTALGGADNDVYVRQPPLTYNSASVYVGHATGRYLYYYEPHQKDDPPVSGWCLSAHLGSGAGEFRVSLGDETNGWSSSDDDDDGAHHSKTLHKVLTIFRKASDKAKAHHTRKRSDLPDVAAGAAFAAGAAPHRAREPNTPRTSAQLPLDPVATGAAPAVATLGPEDAGVIRIPHTRSVLEEAVASGDEATIRYALTAYRGRHPQALLWEHSVGDGLWVAYPGAVQRQISEALAAARATVSVAKSGGVEATVDLRAGIEDTLGTKLPIRCRLRTMFLRWTCGEWAVTDALLDEAETWCLCAAGALCRAAPDDRTLQLLADQGAVDPALWAPPAAAAGQCGGLQGPRALWYERVLEAFLEPLFQAPVPARGRALGCIARARPPPPRAQENRFADGLSSPSEAGAEESAFYSRLYRPEVGTLDFCAALPDNACGLVFAREVVVEMCVAGVMKMRELGRQGEPLGPQHVLALYVYTAELPDAEDQIYAAMNKAMRDGDQPALQFWRPLIWRLDQVPVSAGPPGGRGVAMCTGGGKL